MINYSIALCLQPLFYLTVNVCSRRQKCHRKDEMEQENDICAFDDVTKGRLK